MQATAVAREVMVENWRRAMPPPSSNSQPPPRALNLDHILDLGNTVFFTFRGRAYGIPPLAWRQGEKILATWLEIQEVGATLKRDTLRPYYRLFHRLQKLLWRNARPTGPVRRLLRFFRLHRNPFLRATEGEIAELAVFMLGRRMRFKDGTTMPDAPEPGT